MKKFLIHSSIWIALGYLLYLSNALILPWSVSLEHALIRIITLAGLFYLSGWVLTNRFLIKNYKPGVFLLASFAAIVFFSFIREMITHLVISHPPMMDDGNFYHMEQKVLYRHQAIKHPFGKITYIGSFLINMVVVMIASLYRLYDYKTQKEKESQEQLRRAREAQIQYLKSQVNPHFLFNTLNNLYGLTYSKSDLAPRVVLELSDTMRYMIYETEQKIVPIKKELDFLANYLNLEKMRISDPDNIRISIQINRPSAFIPPLLLLPFIENCFKHGTIGKEKDGWMEVDISDDDGIFYFICKNNYRNCQNKVSEAGIGLENVKKRLDLIFGEKYELRFLKQNGEYMVSLQFPLLY